MMELNEIDRAIYCSGNPQQTMHHEGQIVRIVPTMGLAYLEELSSGRVIGFFLNH